MTEADDLRDARTDFGRNVLGPIIADYLSRLYTHIVSFDSTSDVRVLFVSRAGIRIRRALDAFTRSAGLPHIESAENFWISRLLIAKAVWKRSPDLTIRILSKEFAYTPIPEFLNAMFRFAPTAVRKKFEDTAQNLTGSALAEFLATKSQPAQMLKTHFDEQGVLFESYLQRVLGKRRSALLIDSGWQGTTQTLMSKAFPEYEWWGAYFGMSGFPETDRTYWQNMIGLMFESDKFRPDRPETSIILNRHLIENLFEPSGRSIEWLARNAEGNVFAPDAEGILADDPAAATDPMFFGVLEHIKSLTQPHKPALLQAKANEAWDRLARLIVYPTPQQVGLFADIERSADFGRELKVPIVLKGERRKGDTASERVRDALWPSAQVALEFSQGTAPPIQKKLAGGSPVNLAARATAAASITLCEPSELSSVAVITRTMDRPMFLKRALESVATQTWRDYIHVVVNDGGDNEVIQSTIESTNCDHAKVILIDAIKNRGMEAASNLAISNSRSEFVVIHDDDDSWEPDFLTKTVSFLRSQDGRKYGGVITKSTYCSEEVEPDGIVIHARAPYQGWVENVHLLEMAVSNFFPPIAFVFRRSLWEKLGGYNERYPVLGDWDFNLRFLLEADIGVIPEALANYHHRDRGDTSTFGNSVIASRNKHLEYASIVRNNFVRDLAQTGNAAAATLVGMGLYLEEQRMRVRGVDERAQNLVGKVSELDSKLNNMDPTPADDYWLALARVFKAIASRDVALLGRIAQTANASTVGTQGGIAQIMMSRLSATQRANVLDINAAISEFIQETLLSVDQQRADIVIPADFDEVTYRRQNSDVDAVIRQGGLKSGYEHFIRYGRFEGRKRPRKR